MNSDLAPNLRRLSISGVSRPLSKVEYHNDSGLPPRTTVIPRLVVEERLSFTPKYKYYQQEDNTLKRIYSFEKDRH